MFITAICVPVQVIIIPLECNKNAPNINFRSRNITLSVNVWLFVHFICLSISYSYYDAVALFYRFCCTVWMFLYCYPGQTYDTYHWFKRQLPNWTRPFLRVVRDRLVPKVWRNLRTVIERRRRREQNIDDERSQWNIINNFNLWMMLYGKATLLLSYVIVCVSVSCLLKYYTGWDLALLVPTVIMVLASTCASYLDQTLHYFYQELVDNINEPVKSSCFISSSDSSSTHGAVEKYKTDYSISCTELD